MRIILVAIFAAFCMLGSVSITTAGTYQSNGTYVGTPSTDVTRLFAAFPNGGDGLAAAIRGLLIRDPTLADDVAFVASRSNADQLSAAAAGMGQAYAVLSNRGDSSGAGLVTSAAQLSGNAILQVVVASAGGTTTGQNLYPGGNPSTGTNCTPANNTVSPAQPGTC